MVSHGHRLSVFPRSPSLVLKRTPDQNLSSGSMLVILMTNHFSQFRFAGPEHYWHPSWSFTLTFLRIVNKHVLLVLDCGVLKNPVRSDFTLIPSSGILKRTWNQKLSSGLMLVTSVTTHLFQTAFLAYELVDHFRTCSNRLFSWGHDPYTHAWKARHLTTVG